jgi:protein gp37
VKNSVINWTHHTFNAWVGCSKVSPGCKSCYAEAMDRRELHDRVSHWGPGAPRKVMSDAYWKQPLKWNAEAVAAGERRRVFCSSMADVFDEVTACQELRYILRQLGTDQYPATAF